VVRVRGKVVGGTRDDQSARRQNLRQKEREREREGERGRQKE